MSCLIRTLSNAFDVHRERINPLRNVPGASLLAWLLAGLSVADIEPEPVSRGWCARFIYRGRCYQVITAGDSDEDDQGMREWFIEIDRVRNGLQRLLGLGRLRRDDPCILAVLALLRRDGSFHYVSAQRGG